MSPTTVDVARACSSLEPPPVEWDPARADKRAYEALRWLASHYPEAGGLDVLDPYHDAVHEAAIAEDRGAYEEALREYMRAGRREALRVRRRAA